MTITKRALENLYWNQELSIRAIASLLGVSHGPIERLFRVYKIPMRSKKEAGSTTRYRETWALQHTGVKHPLHGIALAPTHREKISRSQIGNKNAWRGGVRHSSDGYTQIWRPDHPNANNAGYVYEHRLVVEKREKRYLGADEIIHHINGDRRDNRPENLEIRENIEHLREHYWKWRREIPAFTEEA